MMMRRAEIQIEKFRLKATHGDLAMTITCTCRSALAVLLSFSLFSMTCVAQSGAQQFPEDRPGFPQYPTAQSRPQRSAQDVVAAAGRASLDFPPDRNDSVALQCDQLADHPSDPQRIGDGVVFEKIQVDQALPVCEQAAERQPARPRYQYLYGRVLDAAKRYPDAAAQYAAADQAGYGFASFGLAVLYTMGQACRKTWNKPCASISAPATPALPMPLTEGGELYLEENPPNYVEAKSWFEHAVQGGSADGFDDLGWLYESGSGVNKDAAIALSLFNEAAKRGSAEGMYRRRRWSITTVSACRRIARTLASGLFAPLALVTPMPRREAGFCYYNGTGVPQDHRSAFNWFVLAGQAGLVDARFIVADMLDRGDGFNQDSAGAVAVVSGGCRAGRRLCYDGAWRAPAPRQGSCLERSPSHAMVRQGGSEGICPRRNLPRYGI